MLKVGAIVIGQNFVHEPWKNGVEGQIIGEEKERVAFSFVHMRNVILTAFVVRFADGEERTTKRINIRLKRPPGETGEKSIMDMFKVPNDDLASKDHRREETTV